MASAQDASHPYTCNTCQVAFKGSELQRGHMQSDWHRYNLKRRVASLPPLTSDIFTEKVLANQVNAAATAAKASFERICATCQRTYFSENAYQNHLQSQKHRLKLARLAAEGQSLADEETNSVMSSAFSLGEPIDVKGPPVGIDDPAVEKEFSQVVDGIKKTEVTDQDPISRRPSKPHPSATGQKQTEHPLSPASDSPSSPSTNLTTPKEDDHTPLTSCLFCNTPSSTLETNVTHMRTKHGLFLPEQRYLTDLPGLVTWLSDRVRALHECLYCGTLRHSTTGIQTHMRDKGHCMIAFESEEQMLEVGQFYDFSSTYSDDEASENDMPEDGEGWETDDDDEDDNDDSSDRNNSSAAPRKRPSAQPIYHDDSGLHLPSGRIAGHRSLSRYFRQNLHNYPAPDERASRRAIADGSIEDDTDATTGTVIKRVPRGRAEQAISRGDGGLGMLGVPDQKKDEIKKVEKADQKKAQRSEKRYRAGVEKRANNQKHYRDALLQ